MKRLIVCVLLVLLASPVLAYVLRGKPNTTRLGDETWGDGSEASIVLTFALAGTDTVWTIYSDKVVVDKAHYAMSYEADDNTSEPGNGIWVADNDTAFTNDPTCANSGAAGFLALLDTDEGATEDWAVCDGTAEIFGFALQSKASTELTIAADVITITGPYHTVDTETDAATDDLDTINGTVDSMILVLRAAHADRTVVVKDGAGNIILDGGDFSLDHTDDVIVLFCDGTNCYLIRKSNNS